MNKNWIHTGETETGLEIWVKEQEVNGERYLFYQYRNNEGIIIYNGDISFKRAKLLNSLVDTLEMENGI